MEELDGLEEDTAVMDFSQQQEIASADGWLQGRYYAEEGARVGELLSYNSVFEVHPFEVGVDRRAARRKHAVRFKRWVVMMELESLLDRPFNSLSNGEMRRVLFVRAVLKAPKRLILKDPMAGLDPSHRRRMSEAIGILRADGVEVIADCHYDDEEQVGTGQDEAVALTPLLSRERRDTRPVIEINHLNIRFGRRQLFSDFSWHVNVGERWVVRGPNGSGKTTLMALVTGDSPLAYANDVKVFGIPRKVGQPLDKIRRRISCVSPEMQTYLGGDANCLLDQALAQEPDLLILDEPCLNLSARAAKALLSRLNRWLRAHPKVTAIVIAHRPEHVPAGFDHLLQLGKT